MSSQLAIEFCPTARRDDPATSIDAGRRMESTGKSAFQRRLILDCLECHGALTAKEIGRLLKLSNTEVSRRSGELVGFGKPCRYGEARREGCLTWELQA